MSNLSTTAIFEHPFRTWLSPFAAPSHDDLTYIVSLGIGSLLIAVLPLLLLFTLTKKNTHTPPDDNMQLSAMSSAVASPTTRSSPSSHERVDNISKQLGEDQKTGYRHSDSSVLILPSKRSESHAGGQHQQALDSRPEEGQTNLTSVVSNNTRTGTSTETPQYRTAVSRDEKIRMWPQPVLPHNQARTVTAFSGDEPIRLWPQPVLPHNQARTMTGRTTLENLLSSRTGNAQVP